LIERLPETPLFTPQKSRYRNEVLEAHCSLFDLLEPRFWPTSG
jgi:hypothetical protein